MSRIAASNWSNVAKYAVRDFLPRTNLAEVQNISTVIAMKFTADFTNVFPILANLDQQVVTAVALLTELPAGNSDRRYVSEWLAESLSAIYRIERRLAAEVVPCEPPESRRLRYDAGELVECDSIGEQCSEAR